MIRSALAESQVPYTLILQNAHTSCKPVQNAGLAINKNLMGTRNNDQKDLLLFNRNVKKCNGIYEMEDIHLIAGLNVFTFWLPYSRTSDNVTMSSLSQQWWCATICHIRHLWFDWARFVVWKACSPDSNSNCVNLSHSIWGCDGTSAITEHHQGQHTGQCGPLIVQVWDIQTVHEKASWSKKDRSRKTVMHPQMSAQMKP